MLYVKELLNNLWKEKYSDNSSSFPSEGTKAQKG